MDSWCDSICSRSPVWLSSPSWPVVGPSTGLLSGSGARSVSARRASAASCLLSGTAGEASSPSGAAVCGRGNSPDALACPPSSLIRLCCFRFSFTRHGVFALEGTRRGESDFIIRLRLISANTCRPWSRGPLRGRPGRTSCCGVPFFLRERPSPPRSRTFLPRRCRFSLACFPSSALYLRLGFTRLLPTFASEHDCAKVASHTCVESDREQLHRLATCGLLGQQLRLLFTPSLEPTQLLP